MTCGVLCASTFDLFLIYLIVLGCFINMDRLEALLCCFDAESVHCQGGLCFNRQILVNEKLICWKSIYILKGNHCLDFSLVTGLISNWNKHKKQKNELVVGSIWVQCDSEFLLLCSNSLGCLLFGVCISMICSWPSGKKPVMVWVGGFSLAGLKPKRVEKGKVKLTWEATKVVPQHFFQ